VASSLEEARIKIRIKEDEISSGITKNIKAMKTTSSGTTILNISHKTNINMESSIKMRKISS
jgi:hypothetical protein